MRSTLPIAILAFAVCFSHVACAGTWYVNGSAAEFGDGTSPDKPLETIQEGIDAASDGDTVIVAQGTYVENVQFKGKNIVLRSTDPTEPTVVENTTIHGGDAGPVVTFAGTENETCALSGFTIRNGNAGTGGGICGGTWESRTHATIENNVITVNFADTGAGLAYCDGLIRKNTVADNHASASGGGLMWCDGVIEENDIARNSAQFGGGLGACGGTIQDNTITDNTAEGPWPAGLGGGLLSCNGIIQNDIVSRNSATLFGGGLMFCDGIIRNNTIVGNGTTWGGGLSHCTAVIENCIIWANTASSGGPQLNHSRDPVYSCIMGWIRGGDGNIPDDPQFVDPNTGDYHLKETSPCINGGKNEDWMWDAVDLDGNPRVIGAKVDMGAYEYETLTDTTPPYVSGRDPAPGATRVPLAANIVLHVKDHGSGVDETSILMKVNGLEVTPTITGTPADYTVSYDPPSDFSYSEEVFVTVNAADLTSPANVMQRLTYSFTRVSGPSPVETWYVDGLVSVTGDGTSWETALKTIQQGIDAADDGDTVIVAKGTYAENILFKGLNIALRSTNPLDPNVVARTVIDGNQAGPVVTFAGTEGQMCMLSGFTIRNGKADNGGGICGGTWGSRTRATIENNVITGNRAANRGGAIAFCGGLIRNNTISGNSATGACQDVGGPDCGLGGGIGFCDGLVENNVVSSNTSAYWGGGIAVCGGIIRNNEVSHNTAPLVGGTGGAGITNSQGIIRNNLIAGNSGHSGTVDGCHGPIQNNTIVENSCVYAGALFWCLGAIGNVIVWGNTTDPTCTQVYGSSLASYSDIQSGPMGEGSISADPKFVHAADDCRPSEGSPCIDKGMNEDWMVDALALNGSPRIIDFENNDKVARVDMGAYEAREFVAPVITLVGGNITLECGTPYEEPGYTATDDYDGDITAKVIVTGWVNHTSPGTYALNYSAKDSSGNPAQPKTRYVTVKDTTPPEITLLGDNPMTIQLGTPYVEPGYTATDTCGGDLTAFVVVSGTVNSDAVGSYTLNYSVIDVSLNLAQVTRTVNVVFSVVEIVQSPIEGQIRLTWTSRPGATYTVWSCSDLVNGPWIEEATVPSGGDTTTWSDSDTSSACKFYKIELKQSPPPTP